MLRRLLVLSSLFCGLATARAAAPGPLSCELYEDAQGVLHLRAPDDETSWACFGYAHGLKRAWQMDYFRRMALGRSAEVVGWSGIRLDFVMRLMGIAEEAQRILRELPEREKAGLEAYARGVRHGMMESAPRSYEFQELGYRPEPWEPWHSVAVLLLQSFDQTRKTFETDLEHHARAAERPDRADSWWHDDGMPWDTSILKKGEYPLKAVVSGQPKAAARAHLDDGVLAGSLLAMKELFHSPDLNGAGSNNWVLSPKRSASGKSLFANDPHLSLKHPPFWLWVHVEVPDSDVVGATLPGFPMVVSGTNRFVSWGLTNAYLDTAQVFLIDESELGTASSERPVIRFRFQAFRLPFFFKTFRRTREGWPVLPIEAPKGKAWVLRWTGHGLPGSELGAFVDVMKARSVEEADASLSRVGIPNFNFVFADVKGGIGYRAIGRVFRRTEAPRALLGPSTLKQAGELPLLVPADMPHLLNPGRGFVATANNRHWPEDAAFHGGFAYAHGFRATRIEELLQSRPKHDVASVAGIQCDVEAVDARWLKPELLAALERARPPADLNWALELLRSWDGKATLECKACPIYRRWLELLLPSWSGEESALLRSLRAASNETDRAVLDRLKQALAELGASGPQSLRPWGELHKAFFRHLSGLARFDVPGLPSPGDEYSVNPGTARWNGKSWDHTSGASQRLVVEMSSPPQVHAALAGSQEDIARPDLQAAEGPWRRLWRDCRLERKLWPLDWSKVTAKRIQIP